jgi:hypothetical protein
MSMSLRLRRLSLSIAARVQPLDYSDGGIMMLTLQRPGDPGSVSSAERRWNATRPPLVEILSLGIDWRYQALVCVHALQ